MAHAIDPATQGADGCSGMARAQKSRLQWAMVVPLQSNLWQNDTLSQ